MNMDRIREVLQARGDVRQAIVFGSTATGTARSDSDLDIAIDLGRRMSTADKIALIRALAQVNGRPVDVADLHTIGEPLLGQVLKHGKSLIHNSEDHADLLRRHVFDSEDFLPYVRRMLHERRQRWIGMS